jgi:N-dimethylarginine dimethylaminohydrolase
MVLTHVPAAQPLELNRLQPMPYPKGVLMCPPEYFDVIDVKNPYMEGQQGHVDQALARQQWLEVKKAFEAAGAEVRTDMALPGCEDMVFCANPVFTGLDGSGERVCVLSHMRYRSRQREVDAHAEWFRANGYRVALLTEQGCFEGSGDALWHPGRRLIWGGFGYRTDAVVYDEIGEIFDAPVLTLKLASERFYHLDTCFAPLDEFTVMIYEPAFTREGVALIRSMFRRVVEVNAQEAANMACNAAAFFGRVVVIQSGSPRVNQKLRDLGFEVMEVNTSEFLKSGGSVFCMKMHLF